jgi:hypothetical protein
MQKTCIFTLVSILTSLLHTVYKTYVIIKETKQNIQRNIKESNGAWWWGSKKGGGGENRKLIYKIKASKSEIMINTI